MSIEAAAGYCGVTPATVRNWINSGELRAKGAARRRTVARADLERRKKRTDQ
ncbi:helix-turn-helix domain-containing protein [Sedimentitalea nanhaiensis]|uniref:helix-turn-helix domain-containing protein n=1 Tax=Sedimentitalea nanhaiensis TaxID=999627 RepID=UPI0009DF1276